jgi:hypothetical protein
MADIKKLIDVAAMSMSDRVEYVVKHAIGLLPAAIGRQLLTLIEPQSLTIMTGIFTVWAGAQFFGIGEVADVIILVGGWVMFGGVAIRAAELDFESGRLTASATNVRQLDLAAEKLAAAVNMIGVQATLAIFLDKPGDAFKKQHFADVKNPNPFPYKGFDGLPKNRWWGYKPKTEGVRSAEMGAGEGGTSVATGDIQYSLKGSDTDRKMVLAHEKIHQFLTPKLQVLRQLRTFMRAQGYNRSYVLRYLEEALAETTAQLRVKGITKANLIEGIKFPIGDDYDITIGAMKGELKQIFLGPITVGGMTYQVWAARRPVGRKRGRSR